MTSGEKMTWAAAFVACLDRNHTSNRRHALDDDAAVQFSIEEAAGYVRTLRDHLPQTLSGWGAGHEVFEMHAAMHSDSEEGGS